MKDKHLGHLRSTLIAVNRREAAIGSPWRYELLRRTEPGQPTAYAVREFDVRDAGRWVFVDPYWGTAQHADKMLKLRSCL